MKTSICGGKLGTQWIDWIQPDDLNFTNDLALLSDTHKQVWKEAVGVAAASASENLYIQEKNKILKYDTGDTNSITHDGATLEELETFTYLRSVINERRGADADINVRTSKAREAF
ncbi:unnamed protein product [Schistosoma mattheei]|uniref:Uncharacterized protein n=1 Tax=Schistosoma mattheei TaxID=31246 RepID=A0A183P5W8_9TREM|nr:unnamed protein product [Schistosoma mattheei]